MLQHFHIDKSVNVIVEAIAAEYVREYWRTKGYRVHVTENEAQWYEGKKRHDLKDTLGHTWEIKNDVIAWNTPNVYIERTVDDSAADMFIRIVEGRGWVTTREAINALLGRYTGITEAGDGHRAVGTLVPKVAFYEASEEVLLPHYV
jgi:hypothetical protein